MGRLDVRGVSDSVLVDFKNYVMEKYGKKHTVLGLEVESALRFYLGEVASMGHTRTQTEEEKIPKEKIDIKKGGGASQGKLTMVNNVPGDVMFGSVKATRGHKVVMDIVAQLGGMGQWNGHDLNRKIVERLAWKYGGMDPRTVKNYTDRVMSIWLCKENWEPTLIAQAERILEERTYDVSNGKSEII